MRNFSRALVLALGLVSCGRQPPPGSTDLPEIIHELPGTPRSPQTAPAAPRTDSLPAPIPSASPTADADRSGFGSGTIGGQGGRRILVTDVTEEGFRRALDDANRTGRAHIEFSKPGLIRLLQPLPRLTAPWVTLDGNGVTLDGTQLIKSVGLLDIRTHDVVIRNFRLRNGYDNLRIQGTEAYSILVSHVSSTGSEDDGISVSGGAHDVTVQWSFLAGNTRSIFCKYLGTTRISIHHTWIQKGWIRNPLFQGAMVVDLRNVIVEDWAEWGVRFQDGASGNVVGSVFMLSPAARDAGGKADSALRLRDSGAVYVQGNDFRGVDATSGTSPEPIRTASVATDSISAMERTVRATAGCQPRDRTDAAYIALPPGWRIGRTSPLRLNGVP